ncbi:DUF3862 domain-containing protein [Peptococcus simiae]|uniref:DUF3862 domain-containing protein n=1 Tax=Peptococcus simiae TaxID=1643805 RepID=UPI0039817602
MDIFISYSLTGLKTRVYSIPLVIIPYKTAGSSQSESSQIKNEKDTPVTYANFEKLALGSALKEAEDLLGKAKKISDMEGGVIYAWDGNDMSSISVIVKDDQIIEKNQTDLADRKAQLTPEALGQIQDGMTLDQVKAILGDPAITREAKTDDGKAEVLYEWKQADGAAVTLVAVDGQTVAIDKPAV